LNWYKVSFRKKTYDLTYYHEGKMKNFKTFSLLFLCIILFSYPAFAEKKKTEKKKINKSTEKVKPVVKPIVKPVVKPVVDSKDSKKGNKIGVPITVGRDKKRATNPTLKNIKIPKVSENELKLRKLAELVEDLKNKVTATKYRLQLLKEAMTSEKDTLGGAKIKIKHLNKMGGSFKMIRLRYLMDGKLIQTYSAVSTKDKETLSKKTINIPVGHVSPGNVRIRVFITYQGSGYGVFRYVSKWKWQIHNTFSFSVEAGKLYTLTVIGNEKGGWTTPLNKRPQIKFKLKTRPLILKKIKKGSKK
jgi:hypothetical protein